VTTTSPPDRRPFSLGVNLPWKRYGCDFGTNAWRLGGLAVHDNAAVRRSLRSARDSGAEIVRWFVFCDGRAGIDYDAAGLPARLQSAVFDDLSRALDIVGEADLRLVPVLFDFHWTRPARVVNGVTLGGRAWMLRDPVARHDLTVRVVDPVLMRFGRDPRIAMWDLCNEPEWMTRASWPPGARVRRFTLRQWLAELTLHVRRASAHPVTVGLATARGLPLVRGLDLDVLQVHWYDRHARATALDRCPALPDRRCPVVLGEFPSANSARDPIDILGTAHAAGYAGAWGWSLLAQDTATSGAALLHGLRTFRDT
jgi:hypothetical protein